MSHHVSSWAWRQDVGDAGTKLVLAKLADQANDEGVCFPSRKTLLEECEAGHGDTIKQRIRKLKDLGLIIVVPWFTTAGRQTSSMYVLPHAGIPNAEQLAKILASADRQGSAGEVIELRGRGDSSHPSPVVPSHPSGGESSHPSIEEPEEESSRDKSLVPTEVGERASTRIELMKAFGAERGIEMGELTKRERRQWELAADDLVDVDATPADVAERCKVYRAMWPSMRLTPLAIVAHWSLLGAEADSTQSAATGPVERWLASVTQFDRAMAHEILDDRPGLTDMERQAFHKRIDEIFDDVKPTDERNAA